MTCKECIHCAACEDMARALGYDVSNGTAEEGNACDVFERGWVDVKEEQPTKTCLAVCMVKGPCYREMLVGKIHEDESSSSGYVCESDGVFLYHVTHWKYPGLPKEV